MATTGKFETHEWEAIRDAMRKTYPDAVPILLKLNQIVDRAKSKG